MEKKYKVFGQTIAHARKLKDLTQKELAKKLGVTRTYLSMLEAGGKRVDPKHVPKIADVLSLDRKKLYETYFSCETSSGLPYDFESRKVVENKQNTEPEDRLLYAYFDVIIDKYKKSDEKDRANIRLGLESLISKEEKKR